MLLSGGGETVKGRERERDGSVPRKNTGPEEFGDPAVHTRSCLAGSSFISRLSFFSSQKVSSDESELPAHLAATAAATSSTKKHRVDAKTHQAHQKHIDWLGTNQLDFLQFQSYL